MGALERRIAAARRRLFWEGLAPALAPVMGVLALFVLASLFDIWGPLPAIAHIAVLTTTVLCLAFGIWRARPSFHYPTRRAAQIRLETDNDLNHAPLQALDDSPFDVSDNANPLWRRHVEETAEAAARAAKLKRRDVGIAADPYGLRFLASGLIALGLIAAGPKWGDRISDAFAPFDADATPVLVDLWIEPPDYTGAAPIYLKRANETTVGEQDQINAPEGARAIAQFNGSGRKRLWFTTRDGIGKANIDERGDAARAEIAMPRSGMLEMRYGRERIRWPVGVIDDRGPAIAFTEAPAADDRGFVAFSISVDDDYPVRNVYLEMRLDPNQERPLDMPAFDTAALSEVRTLSLGEGPFNGVSERSLDLKADPWAGLDVTIRAIAIDATGAEANSLDETLTLPTGTFFNPLALSVLEQRQTLATAPSQWRRAGRSLDAVTLAPEVFFDRPSDYLLLRTAFWRVMRQNGDDFNDAVSNFWQLAQQLEDEALSLARERLEAAEEALREAIERGASESEIARLTEEMRAAMQDYLQALAQSGQQPEQRANAGEGQQIEQTDLNDMLDAVRDLAQAGAGNAARQMLSDLQRMLENLQITQSGGGGGGSSGGAQQPSGPTGEAGELIGRQRSLADETFERGEGNAGARDADENADMGSGDGLADAERELAEDLEDFLESLQGEGGEDNFEATRQLRDARENMRDAEQALRNGDFDAAASAMEEAVRTMRRGAEELARAQRDGERNGGDAGSGQFDPLGRPVGEAYGESGDVPEESAAARTRALIEDIRKRLSDPDRDDGEINYLERLLERF